MQADAFNRSQLATVIVAAPTTNLRLAAAPGNVLLTRRQSGLPEDCVVNVTRVLTLDRAFLVERASVVTPDRMRDVDAGLERALGLGGV